MSGTETMTTTHGPKAARTRRGSVLVVGAGALGGPAAWLLAEAGVDRLLIADPDVVEISNLNRQVVYDTDDVGAPKAPVLATRIREHFPGVRTSALRARLTPADVRELAAGVDVVLDGTDGVESKFAVHDGALAAGRPLCHAGVLGWSAQVLTVLPGTTCLRCLFPEPPQPGELPTCREAGVMGAVAGTAAAVQASEAMRILAGKRPALADTLLTIDAWVGRWRRVELQPNPRCPWCSAGRGAHAKAGSEIGTGE